MVVFENKYFELQNLFVCYRNKIQKTVAIDGLSKSDLNVISKSLDQRLAANPPKMLIFATIYFNFLDFLVQLLCAKNV